MNKLFTKIAALCLGATMAVGVGVAVASNSKEATPVHAAAGDVITDHTKIVSGKYYYIRAKVSSNPVDYFFAKGGTSTGNGKSRDNIVTSSSNATPVLFTGSGASWTMQFENGNYMYLRSSESNGYYSVSDSSQTWTASTSSNTITFTINSKKLLRNSTYGTKYFGSYSSGTAVTLEECPASKTLSSISLDTTNVKKTFTIGDTFNSTGLVTTANYSDSSSSPVTPTSVSSPDMSTSGQKTVTVSYTEGGVTKTETYTITVNDPRTVTGLTVFDEDFNELADEDEITLTASSGSSISTDVMCQVTYSPSGSDGNVSITSASGAGFSFTTEDNKLYTLTFSANGNHVITFEASEDDSFAITVTYIVSGLPSVTTVTDTIDNDLTGVGTGTTYKEWSGKSDQSDAVYAGQSAGGNTSVQLRTTNSNSGVVTTTSGGVVSSITIKFNTNSANGRKVDVYGKATAYSAATDLYSSSTQGTKIGDATYNGSETDYVITPVDDYQYVGFRSNSGALYLDAIEITWKVEQEIVDVLEYIYIDGSLTTTSYTEGQTISLSGLTVYGHYTTAGDVSLMGKTGLTFGCSPTTATSTSLDEITVNASYEGKNASETYEISVSADSVTALGWGTRGYESGDYFLSGKTLSECIDTSKWTFSPTWASGISKPAPSFGTGTDDVHVGLYSSSTPDSETASALTNNYTFSTADDGKYLVAFYKGTHSTQNKQLFITESLNSIVKPAEGDAGYFLVKDAANLSAGDTVVIAAFNYNYAMSSTQGGNNRAGVEITKDSTDSSATIGNDVQTFTLEAGTTTGTWAFNTGSGYIYAASSSSNYLRTETTKSANSSFTLTVLNTGSAGLVANGSNSRKTMSWNNSSTLFACYTSLQSNGQLAIYKYTEPMDEPINNIDLKVQHVVVEYAKAFNSTLEEVCIAYGSTDTDDLSDAWSDLDTQFTNWFNGSTKYLTSDEKDFAKALFANAKYTIRDSASNDSLQAMLGKYDEILSHYDFDDFLKDDAGRSAAPQKAHIIPIGLISFNNNIIPIVVVISMISVTAIGGYFFLRKRKEN